MRKTRLFLGLFLIMILCVSCTFIMSGANTATNASSSISNCVEESAATTYSDSGDGVLVEFIHLNYADSQGEIDSLLVDGQIDLGSGLDYITSFEGLDTSEYNTYTEARAGFGALVFNTQKYPLSNTALRRAVAFALDKWAVIDDLWAGEAYPIDCVVPYGSSPFSIEGELGFSYYDSDTATANYLLDEAGFIDLNHDGWREAPDGTLLCFNVTSVPYSISSLNWGMAQAVVDACNLIGLQAVHEEKLWWDYIVVIQNHEDYDAAVLGETFGPDPRAALMEFHSSNLGVLDWNYANFDNSTYDHFADLASTATTFEEAYDACSMAQSILAYECPMIPLYQNKYYSAVRSSLVNIEVDPYHGAVNYDTLLGIESLNGESMVDMTIMGQRVTNPFQADWWYFNENTNNLEFNPLTLIYDSLGRYNSEGAFMPSLADSWTATTTEDTSTLAITIRDDAFWHDLTSVTADDVAFTYDYMRDNGHPLFFDAVSRVTSVDIIDEHNLEMHLDSTTYWDQIAVLDVPILPLHIWQEIDSPYEFQNENPIGSGPFSYYASTIESDILTDLQLRRWRVNTPVGADIELIDSVTGVDLTYSEITSEGITVVTQTSECPQAPAGFGLAGSYYDISTTAAFSGLVEVAIPYDEASVPAPEENLRLMHYDSETETWEDVTVWVDTEQNIIYGEVSSFSVFAIMTVTDLAPPVTSIQLVPSYSDVDDIAYVTQGTDFSLAAIDDCSGVSRIEYRINEKEWQVYLEPFSLTGLPGTYLVEYRAIDKAGNIETPQSITVKLRSFAVDSWIGCDANSPTTYFDYILKNEESGGVRLVTTNPGQFHYSTRITNTWPIPIEQLTLEILIPEDFVLKGENPIHVFLDDIDITESCVITANVVVVTNVPAESTLLLELHLEYGLRGTVYDSAEDIQMTGYSFAVYHSATSGYLTEPGEGLSESGTITNMLISHLKKTTAIAGFVFSAEGSPLEYVTIDLFNAEGEYVTSVITDELGFYYFLDIEVDVYTIHVQYGDEIYVEACMTIKNELVIVDIYIEHP